MIVPNAAFVLAILGILFVFCEFIRPGSVIPGLVGGALLVTGSYFLYLHSPARSSLLLIAAAIVLFLAESIWNTRFAAGVLGTAALAAAFCRMYPEPPRIAPGLAIPVCSLFGAITTALAYIARRARQNKQADLN